MITCFQSSAGRRASARPAGGLRSSFPRRGAGVRARWCRSRVSVVSAATLDPQNVGLNAFAAQRAFKRVELSGTAFSHMRGVWSRA
jgi:hypothetical protein